MAFFLRFRTPDSARHVNLRNARGREASDNLPLILTQTLVSICRNSFYMHETAWVSVLPLMIDSAAAGHGQIVRQLTPKVPCIKKSETAKLTPLYVRPNKSQSKHYMVDSTIGS